MSHCWPEWWVTKAALWLLTSVYILSANPTPSHLLWRVSHLQRNSLCTSKRGPRMGVRNRFGMSSIIKQARSGECLIKVESFCLFPLSIWKTADWWNLVPQIVWHGWEDKPELSCAVKQLLDKLFLLQGADIRNKKAQLSMLFVTPCLPCNL